RKRQTLAAINVTAVEVPQLHPAAHDDRAEIQPGDRTALIIDDDPTFSRVLLELVRQQGLKGVLALRGDAGLALARKLKPTLITLDLRLPDVDGWMVLDQLKRDPALRHIPVEVISGDDQRQRGL